MKTACTLLFAALFLQGCAGFLLGQATDLAIETAKVPFKIGGAVIDVVAGDDEEKE